jgi:hypothetical protein
VSERQILAKIVSPKWYDSLRPVAVKVGKGGQLDSSHEIKIINIKNKKEFLHIIDFLIELISLAIASLSFQGA